MKPWLAAAFKPGHGERTSLGPGFWYCLKRGSLGFGGTGTGRFEGVGSGSDGSAGSAARFSASHGYADVRVEATSSRRLVETVIVLVGWGLLLTTAAG